MSGDLYRSTPTKIPRNATAVSAVITGGATEPRAIALRSRPESSSWLLDHLNRRVLPSGHPMRRRACGWRLKRSREALLQRPTTGHTMGSSCDRSRAPSRSPELALRSGAAG